MFPIRKVILWIVMPVAAVFFLEHGGWIAYGVDDADHAPIQYGILHIVLLVLVMVLLNLWLWRRLQEPFHMEIDRLRGMMPRRASMVMWILAGTAGTLLAFLYFVPAMFYMGHGGGRHIPLASFLVLLWGGGEICALLTMELHVRLMRWYIGDAAR